MHCNGARTACTPAWTAKQNQALLTCMASRSTAWNRHGHLLRPRYCCKNSRCTAGCHTVHYKPALARQCMCPTPPPASAETYCDVTSVHLIAGACYLLAHALVLKQGSSAQGNPAQIESRATCTECSVYVCSGQFALQCNTSCESYWLSE